MRGIIFPLLVIPLPCGANNPLIPKWRIKKKLKYTPNNPHRIIIINSFFCDKDIRKIMEDESKFLLNFLVCKYFSEGKNHGDKLGKS